jgi:hypothetical protein
MNLDSHLGTEMGQSITLLMTHKGLPFVLVPTENTILLHG